MKTEEHTKRPMQTASFNCQAVVCLLLLLTAAGSSAVRDTRYRREAYNLECDLKADLPTCEEEQICYFESDDGNDPFGIGCHCKCPESSTCSQGFGAAAPEPEPGLIYLTGGYICTAIDATK